MVYKELAERVQWTKERVDPLIEKEKYTMQQSFAWWCFARPDVTPEQLVKTAVETGYAAAELVDEQYWPLVKDYGLTIASHGAHVTIENGLNRREHHDRIEAEILHNLERAVKWQIPNLICFSGNRDGLDDKQALQHTIEGLRRVAPAAEQAGVTLILELLNSKVDHPDYQCDRSWWGLQVCEQVNSPRVKLLYDIYHMQIMEGDIIHTIRAHHPFFAHYHTAGNPGRQDMDDTQEINYPPIFQAIAETGYTGYIGHEFIPRGDTLLALKHAYNLCSNALAQ